MLAPNAPTLFFDRDVGIALPQALEVIQLPVAVEYHQSHFPQGSQDPEWMPAVGRRGWILIGHDSRHHHRPMELEVIREYAMGCFYLWGNNDRSWEKMRCFLNAYERIVEAVADTPRPFIYRITKSGSLNDVSMRRRGGLMTNTLFYGDNLLVLRDHVPDASVDLVYLDPPFNSNASYNVLFREKSGEESPAQIKAFTDTWEWTQETEATYELDLIQSPAVPAAAPQPNGANEILGVS